jgi:hypothetical protein
VLKEHVLAIKELFHIQHPTPSPFTSRVRIQKYIGLDVVGQASNFSYLRGGVSSTIVRGHLGKDPICKTKRSVGVAQAVQKSLSS